MEKRKSAPWFRILALCTAIGLGGTYVWRQQEKAVPSDKVSEKLKPDIPISEPVDVDPPPLPADEQKGNLPRLPQEPKSDERILMPSSKSGIMMPPPETIEIPKQRTLLPGSKSLSPVFDPPKEDKP